MSTTFPLHLFEGYGIELEYMIVDAETLAVRPIADRLLAAAAGTITNEVERGDIAWSNELVLHVIEFKTNGPAAGLAGLPSRFQADLHAANRLLESLGACLMPSAAHPFMDPFTQTRLWPHEYNAIYASYNRIFNCQGHGWSNLQSMHLNLPFAGDEEFARLHAAIRLLMPVMPALVASSPILDQKPTGLLDSRMEVYRHNARKIPSITGGVIPEPVFSRRDYEDQILAPMYRDIRPHDLEGVLQHEWLNSRGAIARFERDAIEIRILDVQECVQADLAAAALIVAVLKEMTAERWIPLSRQKEWLSAPLTDLFLQVIREGEAAVIQDPSYLAMLGLGGHGPLPVRDLWRHLAEACDFGGAYGPAFEKPLQTILDQGCLARRILAALGNDFRLERQKEVYLELCRCLAAGASFVP